MYKENIMRHNTNNNNSSGGIGFCGLLTILFVGLKLTGYITWSWWWVLSPLLIPVGFILLVFLLAYLLSK